MARRLRESDDFPNSYVAGWESRDGKYHSVYSTSGDKVGRNPTDRSLESAVRIVIQWNDDFYTLRQLTPDYTLDDAISELQDLYKDK